MNITNRINHAPRLVGAAVLFVGATMSVLAGPANADSSASAEGQPEKVFVCKYVGTPDVDERLQTGNNPIEVSVNAIPIYTGQPASDLIGKEFADAQGRSIVIAVSPVRGGGQGDEPTIEDCPAPAGPPADVVVAPAVTVVDNCGTATDSVTAVVNAGYTAVTVQSGLVYTTTFTALEGFVLNAAITNPVVTTLTDAACPTNPVIVKTQDQECVGNALVTTFFENGVVVGSETVNGAKECKTGGNEVLGESATSNGGNNNGANNNGGGTPDVLGEQAFANNAPAAAQQSAPASSAAPVPTVINAGTAGEAPANPLAPAAIALFGALMGLIALRMRGGLARVGGGKA